MDFFKFMDRVFKERLDPPRLDFLDDPREGRLTDHEYGELSHKGATNWAEGVEAGARVFGYVSCWCETSEESMEMWGLYGSTPGRVAVKIRVHSLTEALAAYPHEVCIARVKYQDWRTHSGSTNTIRQTSVRKSLLYRHEKEVRVLVVGPLCDDESGAQPALQNAPQSELSKFVSAMAVMHAISVNRPSLDTARLLPYLEAAAMKHLQLDYSARLPPSVGVPILPEACFEEVVIGPQAPNYVADIVEKVVRSTLPQQDVRRSQIAFSR